MMTTEKQIKIIKRAERHESQAASAVEIRAHIRNSDDGMKRDAVAVVAGWVQELRRKKVAEAARGFKRLFSQSATDATRG